MNQETRNSGNLSPQARIIWTNLTVSLDGQQTANTLFVKMLDQIYVLSPLR